MSERILPAVVGLATAALMVGYLPVGDWAWLLLIVGLGGLWLLGLWRRWGWVSPGGLILYGAIAAGGQFLQAGSGWLLLAVGLALAAWDLDGFVRRLRQKLWIEDRDELERHHLGRLLAVEAVGLLLGAAALGLTLELGFGLVLLLGVLAIVALSRVMTLLRQAGR